MASTALTLSHLPRTSAALKRPLRRTSVPWWRAFWRRARTPLVCDRCARAMTDFMPVAGERVCIRCVASARLPLAQPELAGAAAVLRTLLLEADLEWRAQRDRPFVDERRLEAILAAADVVLWWITPSNLRRPDATALDERTTLQALAAFDRVWALRSARHRCLCNIFAAWRGSQAKAQRYAELAEVDRRYAAWIEASSAR